MPTYDVDMLQVDYIVGEMDAITKRINQTLEDLDSAAKINLSQWTSDAQAVYAQVKLQWDTAAQDMTAKSQNAVSMLGQINQSYSDGERQGMSIWGQ
jgi:uncharacterized protein YukE